MLVLSKKILKSSLHWGRQGELGKRRVSTTSEVCQDSGRDSSGICTHCWSCHWPGQGQCPKCLLPHDAVNFKNTKEQNPYRHGSCQPICCGPSSSVRLWLWIELKSMCHMDAISSLSYLLHSKGQVSLIQSEVTLSIPWHISFMTASKLSYLIWLFGIFLQQCTFESYPIIIYFLNKFCPVCAKQLELNKNEDALMNPRVSSKCVNQKWRT